MDEKIAGSRISEPPQHVRHVDLGSADGTSRWKRECPACERGVLCVRRDASTLQIAESDRCVYGWTIKHAEEMPEDAWHLRFQEPQDEDEE